MQKGYVGVGCKGLEYSNSFLLFTSGAQNAAAGGWVDCGASDILIVQLVGGWLVQSGCL